MNFRRNMVGVQEYLVLNEDITGLTSMMVLTNMVREIRHIAKTGHTKYLSYRNIVLSKCYIGMQCRDFSFFFF